MPRKSSRDIKRIDYRVFHRTEVKMSKVEEQSSDKESSEMNDLIDQETMLSRKFVRLLEEYDLTILYDI